MFTREEQKQINKQFWDAFRIHMKKHLSSNGRKMNWINYPTDVEILFVRMEVNSNSAKLCFDSQSRDSSIRDIIWEQLEELKNVIELNVGTDAIWTRNLSNQALQQFDRIYWEIQHVNYYKRDDHPIIFNFLETKLLGFDLFYQEFKDILITLTE